MREIKFRGICLETRKWVYGNIVTNCIDANSRIIAFGIKQDGCYPVEVNPETIGQFTGLKDGKGNEVWEGDKTSNGYVIMWDKEKCLFAEHWFMTHRQEWSPSSYPIDISRIQIIGNIHQP